MELKVKVDENRIRMHKFLLTIDRRSVAPWQLLGDITGRKTVMDWDFKGEGQTMVFEDTSTDPQRILESISEEINKLQSSFPISFWFKNIPFKNYVDTALLDIRFHKTAHNYDSSKLKFVETEGESQEDDIYYYADEYVSIELTRLESDVNKGEELDQEEVLEALNKGYDMSGHLVTYRFTIEEISPYLPM